jgi:pimeloyl-ACP methyl ester carboxylesterase
MATASFCRVFTVSRRDLLFSGSLVAGAAALAAVQPSMADVAGAADPTARADSSTSTGPSPLKSETFSGEGLFALGAAGVNTAEVGEVLTTIDNINAKTGNPATLMQSDFDAYVDEFVATGSRLSTLAQAASGAGQSVTAKYRHLRAGNYMTQALYFVLGTSQPSKEEQLFDLVDQHWHAALANWTPTPVQLTVKAGRYTLPVYLFRPDGSGRPRPTLIISDGSDGQNVETIQFGVVAGLERGYNIVLFEGPGQMSLLFKKGIPFTPNWDQIVGPIVQVLSRRRDVRADRIGLVGLSFAGMLCARAAARTPGLRAVVLEPAAVDMASLWSDTQSVQDVQHAQNASPAAQAQARQQVNARIMEGWPYISYETRFVIHKRSEIFTTQCLIDARAGRPPTDYYGLIQAILRFNYTNDYKAIKIPTLLTANEDDQFFGSQSTQAFALMKNAPSSNKQLIEFTSAEGAQFHDQPMAPQYSQEVVFEWLAPYMQN